MVIQDRVHGRIVINEPVIAALVASKPMQRLKQISQDGASHFIQPIRDVTRYEHSIGAWYLSYLYHRPIEEQIASLLHDIPHTAFSHVIDIVMDDVDDAYHDKFTKEVILASEIPEICAKHHIDIKKVLNKENYQLLENDLPDISVDRWDYFMRDGFAFGVLPKQVIRLFVKSVKEKDAQFYFEDTRVASLFALMFITCSRLIWLDPSSHGSYYVLADVLKHAVKQGILSEKDFFKTDDDVLGMLRAAHDKKIDALLARLQPGKEFIYADKEHADYYGRNKPRFVDPLVEQNGTLKRVSELVPSVRYYFDEFKDRYQWIGVKQVG